MTSTQLQTHSFNLSNPPTKTFRLFNFETSIAQIIDQIAFAHPSQSQSLGLLQQEIKKSEVASLREGILNLNVSDRAKLLNRIPQDSLENLISISQEKSGALGWNRLLAFGEQEVLKGNQEVGSAVLGFIKTSGAHGGAPLPIRQQAQKTIHILQGQWAPFEQASYSLSRLVPNALDYRVISPIIGASLVGRLVGTWALGRIAWGTGFAQFLPKFFHQGLAARFTAGMISVAAETPMYVAGNRFFLVSMTLVRRRWRRGI